MASRRVRFGYQIPLPDMHDPIGAAQRAERAGFDVVLVSDHVALGPSPLATLGALARETSTIRLGTLVLNNSMRNPVQLGWEIATLDRFSGGRIELGLGAGHTPQEYQATGIPRGSATDRKSHLTESVEVLRRLFAGDTVDYAGDHLTVRGAQIEPPTQPHLPILIGGNGARLMGHAGAHADIIGLQGLGKTLTDGHTHEVRWADEHITAQLDRVRAGAGARYDDIELNALVQVVTVTDDRDTGLAQARDLLGSTLSVPDAAAAPYLMIGTVDEICDHIDTVRKRWGITYFVVRDIDAFAPVIKAYQDRQVGDV